MGTDMYSNINHLTWRKISLLGTVAKMKGKRSKLNRIFLRAVN